MTVLSVLEKAFGVPANKLRELLTAAASAAPDLAPLAAELIAKLDEVATPEALAALAGAILSEVKDIASGRLDPRDHPSDLA